MENLKFVSNEELLSSLKEMRGGECQIVAEIVSYLAEVDSRQVYRDYGYSSLFSFCMHGLGYSEEAAQRRITAARCLRDNAEVYELLRAGKVSLCSLSQVARVITPENKAEVLLLTQGLPKQKAQELAARYLAPVQSKREVLRAKKVIVPATGVAATVAVIEKYALSVELDGECRELLERARDLSGEFKVAELMKVVLREYVERRKPRVDRKKVDPEKKPAVKAVKSRYIVRKVRDEVRVRDGERCSFVSADGVRCCERRGLEFDHVVPFARGGGSGVENLRLVCRAHNQLLGERSFGWEFMDRRRRGR